MLENDLVGWCLQKIQTLLCHKFLKVVCSELSCMNPAAKPADRAEVVGHSSPAAVGVEPAHKHRDPVCAPAGGLGGGEDGSLPPDPGAGTCQITVQKGALLWDLNSSFPLGLELPHTHPGSDSLRAESEGDCD